MKKKFKIGSIFKIAFLWFFLNLTLALFSWGKSYFVDFGARPTAYQLDLRKEKQSPGEIITFVATQPEPEKAWYFGHLWVWFGKDLPHEPKGKTQFGYYSQDQNIAAIELAKALLNPFGFYFGQTPVKGEIRFDDPWPHHLELRVNVDKAEYQNAIKAHENWRAQSLYINRPKWGQKSYACQDYAFDIARHIGMKTPEKTFGEFPPESFVDFAKMNGVQIQMKPSLGAVLSH